MPTLYSPVETQVQPARTPADAQGGQFTPAIGQQEEHLGSEGARVTGDINRIQYLQKTADAKANLDLQMANGFRQFTQYGEEQKAKVGPDGAGYTDKMMAAYDNWSAPLIDQQPTPQLKQMAALQAKTLGNHFFAQAMNWENDTRRANRIGNIDDATTTNAATLWDHPELYDTLKGNQLDGLSGIMGDLHPGDLPTIKQRIVDKLAISASDGWANRNPQLAKQLLLGASPEAPDTPQGKILNFASGKLPQDQALAVASIESKFNPIVDNIQGSGAHGLFQMMPDTFKASGGTDPNNVDDQVKAGVTNLAANRNAFKKAIGRDPSPGELMLSQFGTQLPIVMAKAPDSMLVRDAAAQYAKNPDQVVNANLMAGQTVGQARAQWDAVMAQHMRSTAGFVATAKDRPDDGSPPPEMPNFLKDISPQQREAVLQHATNLAHKDDSELKNQIAGQLQDRNAAFARGEGTTIPAPSLAELVSVHGMYEGQRLWQKDSDDQANGAARAQMKVIPPDQQMQIIRAAEPGPDATVYQRENYTRLVQQAQAVNSDRAADPNGYDQAQGLKISKDIDFNNEQTWRTNLQQQLISADQVSKQYGTPWQAMSNASAQSLSQKLAKAPPENQEQILQSVRIAAGARPDKYLGVLHQIAPDQPVIAQAGAVAPYNAQDATMLLKGNAMSHDDKAVSLMPKEELFKQAWHDAGADIAYFGLHGQSEAMAFASAKAYYAAAVPWTARSNIAVDPDTMKKAIQVATGGLVDTGNGGKTVPPYGMPPEQFPDAVANAWPQVLKQHGLDPETHPVSSYALVARDNGQYYPTNGADVLRDPQGNPVVLDLRAGSAVQPDATPPVDVASKKPPKPIKLAVDPESRTGR